MELKIVFEDEQKLVVDKPAGVVVNRAETIKEETVQDWIEKKFKVQGSKFKVDKESDFYKRAGIVHRLDRETSGLLVVAKNEKAFEFLQKQFKDRKVVKKYIALVHGLVSQKEGSIEGNIARIGKFGKFGVVDSSTRNKYDTGWGKDGRRSLVSIDGGKESRTDYEVETYYKFNDKGFNQLIYPTSDITSLRHSRLDRESTMTERPLVHNIDSRFRGNDMRAGALTKSRINYLKHHAINYTLLSVFPKTGRTHQIRVHLKSIGYPVVSDLIYAPGKLLKFDLMWCPRLFLHASALEFNHPVSKKEVKFTSRLPKDLKDAILNLVASSPRFAGEAGH